MTINLIARTATLFTPDGVLDEEANRAHLNRFVDAKLGVYLASGGSGEGFALSNEELRKVYEIGVAECRGKIPVYANPPEQHTAKNTIEQSMIAIEAGVDAINIYPLAGWHGMRPRENELITFYDDVLSQIRHPVALSINPITGYMPRPEIMADIVRKYTQIVAVAFYEVSDLYMMNFRDSLTRPVDLFVSVQGSLNALTMGATGLIGAAANVLPKTHREYIDLYESRRFDEIGEVYARILRFSQFAGKWGTSNARWIKMALRVLGAPGGQGALRPPYQMPSQEELAGFAEGLLALGIPELEEQARTWKSSHVLSR